MNITIETLNERIMTLQEQLSETLGKANAISGAIQECQIWLEKLNKEEEKEEPMEV